MSSLSLLPDVKTTKSDGSITVATESEASSSPKNYSKLDETDGKNLEAEEQKSIDPKKDEKGNKHSNRLSEKDDKEKRRAGDKKKSRIDKRASKSRTGRKKFRSRSKSSSSSSLENSKDEEEEDEEESLPSCPSILAPEESLSSCDVQWLRGYFGKALTQGLKKVVTNKPEDPVSWLAFFLRKWRSLEEERLRRGKFEIDLKAYRSLLASRMINTETNQIESHCQHEGGNSDEGEEGGGPEDTNFQNYHPTSKGVEKDAEDET